MRSRARVRGTQMWRAFAQSLERRGGSIARSTTKRVVLLAVHARWWTRWDGTDLPRGLLGAAAALEGAGMARTGARTCLVWRRHGIAGATALRLWTYWHGQRPLLRGAAIRGCSTGSRQGAREGERGRYRIGVGGSMCVGVQNALGVGRAELE